ncbi:TetR/AcrR family transcriptional regulator [Brachybacterium hainanense]|uniref:TetR/AcrR family transcriptional regulator n=1 Tax=Brachybacterium hainanense TaxID=1541174 RepID=A0ABV6R921_9MICO
MARTPSFDRETVVRAARGVFWDVGYDAASIPALEQATGLRRSSIYHAFGSKRGLFDAAVQSYLDEVIRPRLAPLRADPVAPDAVLDYLDGLHEAIAAPGSAPSRHGCLLINAAGAPIGHDETVSATIASYRGELRSAIGRGVRARAAARDDRPGTTMSDDRRHEDQAHQSPVHQDPAHEDADDLLADAVTGLVIAAFALVRVSPPEAAASLRTARGLVLAVR